MFTEIILYIFYIVSIIGIFFLAFYSITVYRDFKFKITPRINVYFENPLIFDEPDIYHIDLVIRNEGEVAVEKASIKFDRDDIFFDKEYSAKVFRNKLFSQGVNLSPKTEFKLQNVIHTKKTQYHELMKTYDGSEYFRNKDEIITAKLFYYRNNKTYQKYIELTLYHLFYQNTGKTLTDKIGLMEKHLEDISKNFDKLKSKD